MESLLDIRQTSATLGLKRSTLYKLIALREIPFVKLGSRVLFSPSALERWIEARTVTPVSGGRKPRGSVA